MNNRNDGNSQRFYQITINGQLDTRWMGWFDGMILTWCDVTSAEGTVRQTMLNGPVRDQAALYGLLNKIHNLNLELVAVAQEMPLHQPSKLSGTISAAEIALVQQSFALLGEQKAQLALCFYEQLFALEPDLRTLFHRNHSEQARKFLAMLTVLVNGLSHLEMLRQTVEGLGRRHVTYGVEEKHFALVEMALLAALMQTLGQAFTSQMAGAWRASYALFVEMMKPA